MKATMLGGIPQPSRRKPGLPVSLSSTAANTTIGGPQNFKKPIPSYLWAHVHCSAVLLNTFTKGIFLGP